MDEIMKTPGPDVGTQAKLKSETSPLAIMCNDKGGVGKSTTTAGLYEFYIELGLNPVPIDLDRGNSDFAKVYLPKDYKAPAIDQSEGFREIYDIVRAAPGDKPVVVSTPAHFFTRAKEHNRAFLDMLPELAADLGRDVRLVFVTDDKRDSVNYLIELEKHFGHSRIDVIRNNFFATPSGFEYFNDSKIHNRIVEAGGHIIDFPVLAGRIARKININRWSRGQALKNLDRFDVMEYSRWWKSVCEAFTQAGYAP